MRKERKEKQKEKGEGFIGLDVIENETKER
jgi:hypothetical protein